MAGHRLRFVLGSEPSYLADLASTGQELNRRQLRFVTRVLRPGDVFVDVGAYIGLYSLPAAKIVGAKGRVIAFEPYPGSRDLLDANVALNSVAGIVRVESCAIGDETGTRELRAAGVCSINTLTPSTVKAFAEDQPVSTLEVSVTTLDLYCQQRQIVPTFVKIDVEGWELHVLRGMERVLRSEAVVVCEMHPQLWNDGPQTAAEILRVLGRNGRRATDLDGNAATQFDYGPYILEPERRLTGSTPGS